MAEQKFVAINYITCDDDYTERFEELFASRAHAIDRIDGFISMEVLKPKTNKDPYLIVSHWEHQDAFKTWQKSPEFLEGHKRGFEDVRIAREEGKKPPMTSDFKTYEVIAR